MNFPSLFGIMPLHENWMAFRLRAVAPSEGKGTNSDIRGGDLKMKEFIVRYQYVHGRDKVFELAPTSPAEALKIARNTDKAWYRCQSLARVALHTNDMKAKRALLKEAFAAALEERERNRIVSVASWPLKVARRANDWEVVKRETVRLHKVILGEPTPCGVDAPCSPCLAHWSPRLRRWLCRF